MPATRPKLAEACGRNSPGLALTLQRNGRIRNLAAWWGRLLMAGILIKAAQ